MSKPGHFVWRLSCGDMWVELEIPRAMIELRDERIYPQYVHPAVACLSNMIDPGFAEREFAIIQQALEDGEVDS